MWPELAHGDTMQDSPILTWQPGGGVSVRSIPAPAGLVAVTPQTDGGTATQESPILVWEPGGGVSVGGGGAVPRSGTLYYWPSIENLTGGIAATDLDAQNISALPADSLIIVTIGNRGESQWLRVLNASSPVTNTDSGVIVPINYDASLRPYVLYRQLGF
jgi:hypothetical protein